MDVEHVFSHGGLIVSKKCHNLSPQSTHANVLLNLWSKIDGIVPRKELIKTLGEKLCHDGPKTKDGNVIDMDADEDEDNGKE